MFQCLTVMSKLREPVICMATYWQIFCWTVETWINYILFGSPYYCWLIHITLFTERRTPSSTISQGLSPSFCCWAFHLTQTLLGISWPKNMVWPPDWCISCILLWRTRRRPTWQESPWRRWNPLPQQNLMPLKVEFTERCVCYWYIT